MAGQRDVFVLNGLGDAEGKRWARCYDGRDSAFRHLRYFWRTGQAEPIAGWSHRRLGYGTEP